MQDQKLENKNFWESILGVMDSIKGLFTRSEVQTSKIEEEVAAKAMLVEIDVSDPKLQYVEELYDVTTVPYLILMQTGQVLFKGVPNNDSYKTVINILDNDQGGSTKNQDVIDVLKMQVDSNTALETVTNDNKPAQVVAFNPNTVDQVPQNQPAGQNVYNMIQGLKDAPESPQKPDVDNPAA